MKISEANKSLESEIKVLQGQLKAQSWLTGAVGVLVAIAAMTPPIVALFK